VAAFDGKLFTWDDKVNFVALQSRRARILLTYREEPSAPRNGDTLALSVQQIGPPFAHN
jgi:hypothetical protein